MTPLNLFNFPTGLGCLPEERLREMLRDPRLDDSAGWITMRCLMVISAVRNAHKGAAADSVSDLLSPGDDLERKFGHAIFRLLRAVADYDHGRVPATERVKEMVLTANTMMHELAGAYGTGTEFSLCRQSFDSFFHHLFQQRYQTLDTADFRAKAEDLAKDFIGALKSLAARIDATPAAPAQQCDDHTVITSMLTENLRVTHSIRNAQLRRMEEMPEKRRTPEFDVRCYEKWLVLRKSTYDIPPPVTIEKAFTFLRGRSDWKEDFLIHGVSMVEHFRAAIENGRTITRRQ